MDDFTPTLLPPHSGMRPDPEAKTLAQDIHLLLRPLATVFMGSRARGDHRPDSDLDLLIIWKDAMSSKQEDAADAQALQAAEGRHSQSPKIQLAHLEVNVFDEDRQYANSFTTGPLLQGIIFSDNPERYQSPYLNPSTPIKFSWEEYSYHLKNSLDNLQGAQIALGLREGNYRCMPLNPATHVSKSAYHGAKAMAAAATVQSKLLATTSQLLDDLQRTLPEQAYRAAQRANEVADAMREASREKVAALFPKAEKAITELRQCAMELRKTTAAAIRDENRRRANAAPEQHSGNQESQGHQSKPRERDMLTEFQQSVLSASLREMQRALEDPETDPGEHAGEHAHLVGFPDDNTLHADLDFTGLPVFRLTEDGPETAGPPVRPSTISLSITPNATATLAMENPDTGEDMTLPLSPGEQDTVNQYANAACFHLTAVAYGTFNDHDQAGAEPETEDIINSVKDVIEHLRACAQVLARRTPNGELTENTAELEKALNVAEREFTVLGETAGHDPGEEA